MKTNNKHLSKTVKILVLCTVFLCSCVYIKMVKPHHLPADNSAIMIENSHANFYIIHVGDTVWQLNNLTKTVTGIAGNLVEADSKAIYYHLQVKKNASKKVPSRDLYYTSQVHIYANKIIKGDALSGINFVDINKIEVYRDDPGKSLAAAAGVGIAVTVVSIAALAVLINAICGCPHVYVNNGESDYYNNTLFTGATSTVLERNDYQIMPDYFPNSNTYNFTIHNEENETQFTNQLALIVVQHDDKTKVYADQKGSVYAIKNPISPFKTVNNAEEDIQDKIMAEDEMSFNFDNRSTADYADVISTFKKPKNVKDAKLILKVKNSTWSGFVYQEFSKLFGKKYHNWVIKNAKKPLAEVKENMVKAGIPLVVSIKKGEEWVVIEAIDLIGDIAYNTLAIPIDENLISGEDIQIRIRSGFKFWSMDYLAIDFSSQAALSVQHLKPIKAADSSGEDYTVQLSNDDDLYMERLEKSSKVWVRFDGLKNEGKRTIILHSKGYYLSTKNYEGQPNKKALEKLKNEVEFSRYSKELFAQYKVIYSLVSN